jgi:uncharacterized membrane protein YqaE (UPF0057 family)
MTFAEVILAIFFPPISVLLRFGLSKKFWLNLVLTLFGWLPGAIHAFIVLSKQPHAGRA